MFQRRNFGLFLNLISIIYFSVISMSDVVLFGHSLIEHLRKFTLRDKSRENLGLDPLNYNVRFVGLGGLSLRQQRRLRLSESQV